MKYFQHNPFFARCLASCIFLVFLISTQAQEWIHLTPSPDQANGKKIVFVTGDDEYKSETSMPMMAHILAEHHGFDCQVLFAINRKTGVIDTNQRDNIPGLEHLADADLMVIYTRFRSLVDDQMQMIEAYLKSGKPVIGIRTATHAFNFDSKSKSAYSKYSYNNKTADFTGGFGRQVLGETWINHWGSHGRQSSRGRFAQGQETHAILQGIADGEIWGPTDVYQASLPLPDGCQPILLGEVCENMNADSGPASTSDKNNPMMPIAWTWQRDQGVKGRVFTSTIGGAMAGKDDWANEGMRRMFVNACFWTLKMEDKIPDRANVDPVLVPNPYRRGVKPQEALQKGLAEKASKDKTILFYGNSMIERLLENGELEARLQIASPEIKLQVRSLAWTGDEVGNRLRLEKYATHMKDLLKQWPANTIVLGYGLNEAFAGQEGLAEFKAHYASHLTQLTKSHPGANFILLSPIAPATSDASLNDKVKLYSRAISEIADSINGTFVDLYKPTAAASDILLNNGIHLNDQGNRLVAQVIAKHLAKGTEEIDPAHLREVSLAAVAKHKRVAEIVRPKNAVVYFGVRARPKEYAEEMPRYHKMIAKTEAVVHQLASDSSLKFADQPVPSLPPLPERKGKDDGKRTGIIKTVAENQAEFEVADGYKVNLFASEEQFPELRNPVQIAFDARGRLWVVTMPSFPHTVPGLTPPDKILIFEDIDKDGSADKVTTFAEGLDALDGVAFHRDGVIISEQPRLWVMQDTDGDDVADTRRELIRGIDVTDSHHGGMIATDPYGDVIFSDGVFHRSQLETPFGVHRGIDATTYRLDPITGRLHTEFQHTTPNPWNVAFNKYAGIFPMYGDGDVYDGTSLIWTPLGAYQPYAYGRMTSYGKGSGNAIISSPNFPDGYQQGLVSASLLGSYAVNITKLDFDEGMAKQKSYEKIVSSPNAAFRPADVEFGMDGALYVSDFCSPIIGHAQHPMRSPHWDHDYGRIWRVVHTAKPIVKDWPKIEGASVEALCELLLHDQDLVRHHTRIELRKHTAELNYLDEWIAKIEASSSEYLQAVLEVIFVFEGLGQTRPELLKSLLKSKNPLYRGAALQTLRLQADRIENIVELLTPMASDSHPRVQIELIDAVAHLRPINPAVESCLANLNPLNKHVSRSLETLDYGTEPAKGRSVPVLDIDKAARLNRWHFLGELGKNKAKEVAVGEAKLPGVGSFRTFVEAEETVPAIIGVNSKNIVVSLNGNVVFEQNSFWSGDQQINVELKPGLNVVDILLRKGRRTAKTMPPVYLYDPVGQALTKAKYANDKASFRSKAKAYDLFIAERGNLINMQCVAGLQFSPKQLTVSPGSKVRLAFSNPDIMEHNWVLVAPGSADAVGALADQLAASGKGVDVEYIPESDSILVASELLGPKGEQELVFTAPEQPGEYPYICTFPGHWRLMKGVLKVEKQTEVVKTPAIKSAKPVATAAVAPAGTVLFESANTADGFTTIVLPTKAAGKVEANQKTNNDRVKSLTDGKLTQSFGPIFANGVQDGAYRMDLGRTISVLEISSWAYQKGGIRGKQKINLYGSNATSDPGWIFSDKKKYTNLGTISTDGQSIGQFSALAMRPKKGVPSLGKFRWIAWQVNPISKSHENTAFQELSVRTDSDERVQISPQKAEGDSWIIDSDKDWQGAKAKSSNLDFTEGMATPTKKDSSFSSVIKRFGNKRSAKSLTIKQSPVWHNWTPIKRVAPSNLGDAPVMLTLGPDNYWIFGRYRNPNKPGFKPAEVELEGFDIPLQTTSLANQFNAAGGLKKNHGGYHAWQSKDMVNWVHHGAVTEKFSAWVTTAEFVDGKAYIYYDFPNDQDPHVYVDNDLTDGVPGKNMGLAFKDPSDGSDCAFIRDLDGNFHVVYEDWGPLNASTHSWDSPLAGHAVSKTGVGDFTILDPAVDERTTPTGKFAEYAHPHWHKADPKNYPGRPAPEDVPQHRIKKGDMRAFAKYEIHTPEQNAYGDWASICVGGQYYLFADYHPANEKIKIGWFTSPSIDQKFTFCGEIGEGHPDPDIAFAEGKFYLVTQLKEDYVSPGPWVESVETRVGVDTDNDATIDHWTKWQQVTETYDYIPGFAKQIAKTPANLDLTELPEGYGFQFEVRMTDTTENASKPILDKIELVF